MMSMIKKMESKVFSFNDVRTIVDNACNERVVIMSYNLLPFSKESHGFLGLPMNLEVTIKRQDATIPEKLQFFAKLVPCQTVVQISFVEEARLFHKESEFYNKMMPLLQETYVGEAYAPKCYFANNKVIVLEDVRVNGFEMLKDIVMDRAHLETAVRTLARFHATSVLAEHRLGTSFKELYPESYQDVIYTKVMIDMNNIHVLLQLTEAIGREHNRDVSKLGAAFQKVSEQTIFGTGACRYNVILHADSWTNNFMFATRGSKLVCLIVDFQLIRYGNRMWDVSQLLYFSLTREIRQKEERVILEAYHEEFNDILRQHDSSLEIPSLEETLAEYEEARLHGLFTTMFYYPFMLLDSDEKVRLKALGHDLYTMFIFRSDNSAVVDMMKRNKEYKCKISDVALELIDLSNGSLRT